MKQIRNHLIVVLSGTLLSVACTKKGDPGPQGPAGPQGASGSTGATGATGTSNVIYSKWIAIDSSKWTYDPNNLKDSTIGPYSSEGNSDTLILYHADIPTPGISQSILDSGMVYYFIKDSTLIGNGGAIYPWIPSVNNMDWPVGISNQDDGETNFLVGSNESQTKDKITFYTSWLGYDNRDEVDLELLHFVPHYKLRPRTKLYLRYIAIPGGMKNGRISSHAPLDFKDYKAIKEYYKLPD